MTAGRDPLASLRYIYVVAGNYREFMFWCKENKVRRNDQRVHFISDFSRLMGVRIEEHKGDRVVLYGTYESRMDWLFIVEELKHCWQS